MPTVNNLLLLSDLAGSEEVCSPLPHPSCLYITSVNSWHMQVGALPAVTSGKKSSNPAANYCNGFPPCISSRWSTQNLENQKHRSIPSELVSAGVSFWRDVTHQARALQSSCLAEQCCGSLLERPQGKSDWSLIPPQNNCATAALPCHRKCIGIQDLVREINTQSIFKGRHTHLLLSLYL